METIKNNFSTLLGAKRLKISDVSRDTGISRQTLTPLYYGREAGISYRVLGKLCSYLNCSVGDLLEVEREEMEDGQCRD